MGFLRWWEGFVGMGVGMGMGKEVEGEVEGGWYVFCFSSFSFFFFCWFGIGITGERKNKSLTISSSIHPQLQLPTNTILLASSLSSTLLSITALALQATLNHQSPHRDTLQTWTCMWKNVQGEGVPQSFDTLCHETVSNIVPYLTSQKTIISPR